MRCWKLTVLVMLVTSCTIERADDDESAPEMSEVCSASAAFAARCDGDFDLEACESQLDDCSAMAEGALAYFACSEDLGVCPGDDLFEECDDEALDFLDAIETCDEGGVQLPEGELGGPCGDGDTCNEAALECVDGLCLGQERACPETLAVRVPAEPVEVEVGGELIDFFGNDALCDDGTWTLSVSESPFADWPIDAVTVRAWDNATGLPLGDALALVRNDEEGTWTGESQLAACDAAVSWIATPTNALGAGASEHLNTWFDSDTWSGSGFGFDGDIIDAEAYAVDNAVDAVGVWVIYPTLGQAYGPYPTRMTQNDFGLAYVAALGQDETNLSYDGAVMTFVGCKGGEVVATPW